MKNFIFKLQTVLQLRKRERDEAAHGVQLAVIAKQKLEAQIKSLHQDDVDQQPVQLAASRNEVDPQKLLESQRYQMQLRQQIHRLSSDRDRIETEIEQRRQLLVEKEKQVKSLEKLRHRQEHQYRINQSKQEQTALDQWAGFRYWQAAVAPKDAR